MLTRLRRHAAVLTAAALAASVTGLAVARTTEAGFSSTTGNHGDGWGSGSLVLSDDDTGAALFNSGTDGLLDAGQTLAKCIAVTYNGTLNPAIRLRATAIGTLADYLTLTVEEGTGGGAGSCTGFTPASTAYTGTLAAFAAAHSTYATGAAEWTPTTFPATKTYRVTLTVQNTPAAQNATATGTFTWEAQKAIPQAVVADTATWGATSLGSSPSLTLTAAPQVGDFAVAMSSNWPSLGQPVSGINGLGATWTLIGQQGGQSLWIGRNPSVAGTITFNSGTSTMRGQIRAILVRNVGANPTVTMQTLEATATTVTGPSMMAPAGSLVLNQFYDSGESAPWPTVTTPGTGWTVGTITGAYGRHATAVRAPRADALHSTESTAGSSRTMRITQVVFAPPA